MRLDLRAVAITGAITAAVFYVGGAALNLVLSWGTPALVSYIFHVDVIELSHPMTWDSFFIGIAVCAVTGAAVGAIVGSVYNGVLGWLNAPAHAKSSEVAPARTQ